MNSIHITIIALFAFFLGYRFYSKFLSEKVFDLQQDIKTPSHELKDNIVTQDPIVGEI